MVELTRARAVERAVLLNRVTIAWNSVEGAVAVAAGLAAGSVSLLGFGFDSAIEVAAAVVVAWRLRQESGDECTRPADRRATRAMSVTFGALAIYVGVAACRNLVSGTAPAHSGVGIVLAIVSLVVMPALARAKRRLAPTLGSTTVAADARQTDLCALLSGVVLVGLMANAFVGWWWADPVAGLVIAVLASWEAARTWRAESLADTCCA